MLPSFRATLLEPMLWENTMKHLLIPMMLSVSLVITSTGLALAANVHAVTEMKGQPDQTIGTAQTGERHTGPRQHCPRFGLQPER